MNIPDTPPKAESSEQGTDATIDWTTYENQNELIKDLYAKIEQLTAENERLRAALENFTEFERLHDYPNPRVWKTLVKPAADAISQSGDK